MSKESGIKHWKHQRITAMASLPFMLWLVFSIVKMQKQNWSYEIFSNWLSSPINGSFMILSIVIVFYHAFLGLEVIIEDYVHDLKMRALGLLITKFSFLLLSLISLLSVFKVMFA
jgi:succinate dehydrogenase / fumarate reductase membrane anchor subunit